MPVARRESSDVRIIAHIDMDCFYVQVEQRKQPSLRGLPTAVVQYNSWKGGGLIAVSYEARKCGVKRSMRGDEAKEVCPNIQLVQVPVARGKADLNIYRNAGSEVVSILSRRGRCERASIDEVYLDLTDAAETMLADTPPESLASEQIDEEVAKSHVLGLHNAEGSDRDTNVRLWLQRSDADHRDKLLACGTLIVAELRMEVLKETGFTCSAGIAHNKMLSKLASPMNKPAQQTVVPFSSVQGLLQSLPIKKMKQLGGKLGSSVQSDLGVNTVGDLLQFSEDRLQDRYGINTGTWLWNISRGICGDEVEGRLLPKSHGSGKTFPGPQALKTIASVQKWLNQLCEELSERLSSDLDQNKRIAHTLTLHARAYTSSDSDSHTKFPSKSCPLRYGASKIQEDALILFQTGLREYLGSFRVKMEGNQNNGWGVTNLSISASKIVAIPSGTHSIMKYFHGQVQSCSAPQQSQNFIQDAAAPLSTRGTGNVHSTESQIGMPREEMKINNAVSSLEPQEQQIKSLEDQELFCSSSKQPQDGFAQEPSSLLPSESSSVSNQTEKQSNFSGDGIKCAMSNMDRQQERRKASKDKGTPSILSFFQGKNSCVSLKQEHHESSQVSDGLGGAGGQQRRETWDYKTEEIDPSVIDELPPEIQEEFRTWLRPRKRATTVPKQGSSIAHYFLPTKNTTPFR